MIPKTIEKKEIIIMYEGLKSAERILDVLEYFVNSCQSQGVIEVSAAVGLPASTTHRIIQSLVNRGYLMQDKFKKYSLGKTLFGIAGIVRQNNDMAKIARPFMIELSNQTGETVHLCLLEGQYTHLIEKIPSPKSIAYYSYIGLRQEAHVTSFGKAILAYLTQDKLDEYLRNAKYIQYTPKTIMNEQDLLKELAETQARGYAVDDEEAEESLVCIGMPIFDHEGKVAAGLSIAGPAYRVKPQFEDNVRLLTEAAEKLSGALGFH